MSNVKITIEVQDDLTQAQLAETLQGLFGMGTSATVAVEQPAKESASAKPKTTRKPVAKPATKNDASKEEGVTLEALRAAAYELIQAGKRDEVTAAIGNYGAKTLPDVDKADYVALLAELGAL